MVLSSFGINGDAQDIAPYQVRFLRMGESSNCVDLTSNLKLCLFSRVLPDARTMFWNFSAPSFDRPIDINDYVKRVPATATIKGMFLSSLIDTLGANRSLLPESRQKYVSFKDYPLVEQVKLVAAVAAVLHPKLSLREAIRRVGHTVYPTFSTSLVGKVTFAAVGKDPATLLTAGTKAYQFSSNVGRAEVIKLEERFALLGMRDMYNFIDCYQVGILEGALSVIGLKPTVRIDLESLSSGVFELTW